MLTEIIFISLFVGLLHFAFRTLEIIDNIRYEAAGIDDDYEKELKIKMEME